MTVPADPDRRAGRSGPVTGRLPPRAPVLARRRRRRPPSRPRRSRGCARSCERPATASAIDPNRASGRCSSASATSSTRSYVVSARVRWILAEDEPDIVGYDQDRWVDALRHRDDDPDELIALFDALRGANLRLLAANAGRGPRADRTAPRARPGELRPHRAACRPATTDSTWPRPSGPSRRSAAASAAILRRRAGSGSGDARVTRGDRTASAAALSRPARDRLDRRGDRGDARPARPARRPRRPAARSSDAEDPLGQRRTGRRVVLEQRAQLDQPLRAVGAIARRRPTAGRPPRCRRGAPPRGGHSGRTGTPARRSSRPRSWPRPGPRTTTVPPVMYSQPCGPMPSTTASAPLLRTAKRIPARPTRCSRPPVAP